MARRKAKKGSRKSKPKINLLGITESVILANVVSQGLFNVNAYQFVTGQFNSMGGPAGYFPSNSDNFITLPELLGIDPTFKTGQNTTSTKAFSSSGAMDRVKENLKNNGLMMGAQLVTIPIGFRVVTKLTSKPRSTANKLLAYSGLGVKV